LTLDSNGNLFGTTYGSAPGSSNVGSVFEIAYGTTSTTTLASFDSADGANPSAALTIGSNRDLFGTTYNGGVSGDGTVFKIAHGTNSITTLAAFNASSGADPSGVALDSGGDLFGTTGSGGADGDGTVFEIAHGTNSITTLASFDSTNGAGPGGVTLDSAGDLVRTNWRRRRQ